MDVNGEMIRGHIDTIILLSLVDGDKDTNEIRRQIEDKSENKFSVKQGTFYSAMQRLVKQNLIREYRSSSNDGIRRKYFNLTDKGVKFVENNKQEWARSRDLIDSLVSDEKDKSQEVKSDDAVTINPPAPIKPVTEVKHIETTEYEDPLKDFNARLDELLSGENAYETQTQTVSAENRDTDDVLNDENEIVGEEPIIDQIEPSDICKPNFDEKIDENVIPENSVVIEDKSTENDEIANIAAEIEEIAPENQIKSSEPIQNQIDSSELKVAASTEYNLNEAYEGDNEPEEKRIYPFEIKDGDIYEKQLDLQPAVEITVDQSIAAREESEKAEEVVLPKAKEERSPEEQKDIVIEEKSDEIPPSPSPSVIARDDLLEVSDGAKTNRREYKSILSSLFPKESRAEESQNERIEKQSENIKSVSEEITENVPTRSEIESFRDNNVSEYERSLVADRDSDQKEERRVDEFKQLSGDSSDFSDLYAMAAREGFKIKTSSNTNKFSGKRILINKLNCAASITSYLLLFVEMLILNVCLSSVLGWQPQTKAIIAACTAAFPLLMLLIFAFNRSKKVKEISSFKDAIEISLIATFQITIIILCVALFVSVDFGDFKSVCEFILLPFILTLNIPIFFIIKYALLSTGKFYVGQEQ